MLKYVIKVFCKSSLFQSILIIERYYDMYIQNLLKLFKKKKDLTVFLHSYCNVYPQKYIFDYLNTHKVYSFAILQQFYTVLYSVYNVKPSY